MKKGRIVQVGATTSSKKRARQAGVFPAMAFDCGRGIKFPRSRLTQADPRFALMTTAPSTRTPKSPARSAQASEPAASYEAALEELEQLVAQLEGGQLPLDQLLERYQRGAALLAFCRDRLEAVDKQIKVLEGGELKPWDAA
jgi:exodeoxyribonuclease VII small subunit